MGAKLGNGRSRCGQLVFSTPMGFPQFPGHIQ